MATTIGLKYPIWNLTKSRYDEIDELPMMASPGPVIIIIACYLLFVLKIGPNYMRKREAYKLSTTLVLYNGIQVVLSVYLVQSYFRSLLKTGLAPKKCYINSDMRREFLFGMWLYLAAKITELLDTVFFVLRKKDNQITFLHLYHHSIMMIGTWAVLKYWPSHNFVFIGFLNSLVHVFMYIYYGLAALGPNVAKYLTWKKYMTKLQLIQFVSILIQYTNSLRYTDCPPNKNIAIFIACNTFFFLLLFLNFYRKSYKNKSKTIANGVNGYAKIAEKLQ